MTTFRRKLETVAAFDEDPAEAPAASTVSVAAPATVIRGSKTLMSTLPPNEFPSESLNYWRLSKQKTKSGSSVYETAIGLVKFNLKLRLLPSPSSIDQTMPRSSASIPGMPSTCTNWTESSNSPSQSRGASILTSAMMASLAYSFFCSSANRSFSSKTSSRGL